MLIDFRTVTSGTTIETDVCVIGAGAAGITLAREFIGSPLDVCLLESGGFEWDDEIQELYRGENVGVPYQPLETGRGRFLGGTTNLWLGACIPLDASDLRSREWVPHSGWPIAKLVLDPYYKRAEPVCEVRPFDYSEAGWAELGLARLDLDPAKLETRFWQYSPPTRFGEVYRDELAAADNIRAFIYATATNLQADASGSFVDHVDVRSLDGTAAKLRAGAYVIAAGGIENPRLLLNPNSVERAGLGNRHDLVGRFFMEHTYYQSGLPSPFI